jgi:alpha-N-acetylglucosaminidase
VVNAVIKSVFELVPDIEGINNRTGHHPTLLTYDPADVVRAWGTLLEAVSVDPSLLRSKTFHYDFVDVTRQVLANLFIPIYDDMISTWNSSYADRKTVASIGGQLTDLLTDVDRILATDENFLLCNWISAAKSWTNGTEEDTAFLEYDARNQITLWVSDLLLYVICGLIAPIQGAANTVPWSLDRYARYGSFLRERSVSSPPV